MDWMKDLLVNSSEAALTQRVDEKYQALDSLERGGITYLKLLLDEMFFMTNDVVSALQMFINTFADVGLTKTVGENVAEATAQVKAVCERLSEVNQLPQEAPTFFLQGLKTFSVPEFTGPFILILNQERVNQMGTAVYLTNTSAATLTRVLEIVVLSSNIYHSLNTSNAWNIPQGKPGHHAPQFTPE